MKRKRHLTIEEKRDWLAYVFRDTGGEFSQADKFKAMVEDTRLAELAKENKAEEKTATPAHQFPADLLAFLPPPLSHQKP